MPCRGSRIWGASFCIKSEHYSWGLVLSQSIKLCQNDSRWKELLLPDALPSHIGLVPLSLLLSSTSLLGTQTDHLVIPACIHLCSTEAKRTKLSLAAHLARPGFFCGFTDPSLQPHGPTFSPERSERFLHYVSGPSHDAFPWLSSSECHRNWTT